MERGDEILLGRPPHFPPGIYSVLAGFVEPGESVEEAVQREVLEESGILVDDIRYFGSQPWPYPHSLMLGFQAAYAGGEIRLGGRRAGGRRLVPLRRDAAPLPGQRQHRAVVDPRLPGAAARGALTSSRRAYAAPISLAV